MKTGRTSAIRSRVAFALTLGATLALSSGYTTTVAQEDDPDPGTSQAASTTIELAMTFRASFGLRSDREYVEAASLGASDFPNFDWGLPLSTEEAADLGARVALQDGLGAAVDFAAAQDSWAGMYLDQTRGGIPVFQFVDPDAVPIGDLAALMPEGASFEVTSATRTLADLEADKDAISAQREAIDATGTHLTAVSVHVRANRVEVEATEFTQDGQSLISEIAAEAVFATAAQPTADVCSITSCGPDMKGGLEIVQVSPSICTSGYVGRRTDVSPVQYVLVTAGHCVRNGALPWHHAGSGIGTAGTIHGWYNGSWGDVGYIVLNSASTPATKNKALYNPDTNKVVSLTGFGVSSAQQEGYQVCRIGWGSWNMNHSSNSLHNHYTGLQCGQIILYDSDSDGTTDTDSQSCVSSTCKWISRMKVVNFDSTGGDSGGTMFEPTTGTSTNLWGTHVHSETDSSTSDRGWYSIYTWGRQEFSTHQGITITACLVADCSWE
jgi:hypothetical protein